MVGAENLNVGRHVVQFYGRDEELAERVTDYLLGALASGGVAIVIATPEHRHEFETRLGQAGVDLAAARDDGSYLARDAAQTLSELMAPAVDVYINDARTKTTWSGQMLALPDVRDAVARLKMPLATYGGVEVTLFTSEDQITLRSQLELFIFSRSDRWMYLLNSMNLEERASLEERLWGIQSWERAPAPALSDAVAAAADRLGVKASQPA